MQLDWTEILKLAITGGFFSVITTIINWLVNRKKSRADYADILLDASKKIDDKRDKYIEDLQNKLEDESKKNEELEKRLRELEIDVTRLKSIIDLNARYKAFFNMIHHPSFIFDTKDKSIVDANYKCQDVFGHTRDEMIGVSYEKIFLEIPKIDGWFAQKTPIIKYALVKNREGLMFPVSVRLSYFSEGDKNLAVAVILMQNRISTENRIMDFLLSILDEKKVDYVTLWSFHNGVRDENDVPAFEISACYQVVSGNKKYIASDYQDLPAEMFQDEIEIVKSNRYIIFETSNKDHQRDYHSVIGLMRKNKISITFMCGIFCSGNLIGMLSMSMVKKFTFSEEDIAYLKNKASTLLLIDALSGKIYH